MKKYNHGDDDRDNGRNKDGNEDDNAAARSGYDGPIFDFDHDASVTPGYRGVGSGNYGSSAAAAVHYVYMC